MCLCIAYFCFRPSLHFGLSERDALGRKWLRRKQKYLGTKGIYTRERGNWNSQLYFLSVSVCKYILQVFLERVWTDLTVVLTYSILRDGQPICHLNGWTESAPEQARPRESVRFVTNVSLSRKKWSFLRLSSNAQYNTSASSSQSPGKPAMNRKI